MGATRHGHGRKTGHTGWMVTALVLMLVLALLCGTLAFLLATHRITWEKQPDREPAPSATTTTQAPPSRSPATITTTTSPAAVTHYNQKSPHEWSLLLVNSWNRLPAGYEEQSEYADYDEAGNRIDARVKNALLRMMSDGADHGLWGLLLYRDGETQQELFDDEVQLWKDKGYAESEAQAMAETEVVRPGFSEHQTGLAVDVIGGGYTRRDEKFDQTDAFKWLQEHCADYGFILRYPKGKEAITGMDYEPWHYRYVGEEYARAIMSRGITLEEFLEEKGF